MSAPHSQLPCAAGIYTHEAGIGLLIANATPPAKGRTKCSKPDKSPVQRRPSPDDRLGRPRRDRERGTADLECSVLGDAGSNTAADHIEAAQLALAQLPSGSCGARCWSGPIPVAARTSSWPG